MTKSKSKPDARAPEAEGPDGGWGWVLVGALFVSVALVFGLIRSMGVFFVEFVQYFEESAQAISWITSIGVATQQLFSPLGTALCNAYGARRVVMAGGGLAGLGLILASQATSLTHLYLTMGLISGLGWAMVFMPVVATVMANFTRRPSLALGLGFSGIGISSFVFSPLFQLLVERFAWRGALLILGALSLNIVPCGALIRPQKPPKTVTKRDCEDSATCGSLLKRLSRYLELTLLLRRPFLTYSLAICLLNTGYFVPYVHLVAHSRHEGFSEYQAAFIMSATGVTDIVGRVVSGWFSDLRCLRLLHILTMWTGLTGVFMALIPLCSASYLMLLACSLCYGFCSGALTSLVFTVVPEIVGAERVVGALGLLQLLESSGGLLGAPLSGLLRDQTGNYVASLAVSGGFLFLGSVVLTTLPHYFSCADPPTPSPRRSSAGGNARPQVELGLLHDPLPVADKPHEVKTAPHSESNGTGTRASLPEWDTRSAGSGVVLGNSATGGDLHLDHAV